MSTDLKSYRLWVVKIDNQDDEMETMSPLDIEFYHTNTEEYMTGGDHRLQQIVENELVSLFLDEVEVSEEELSRLIGEDQASRSLTTAYEKALYNE